ncbi:MAG TPA: deoxyribonuclease IV [Phycisphaerales bacterium]|nr:deoxyribonuclease IV [Phycisphaerales bacterium]
MAGMIGSHLSIAGGVSHALDEAKTLGMDCVQVFTANQRQWTTPERIGEEECAKWFAKLEEMGWRAGKKSKGEGDLLIRVVSHNSYLVNLASPSEELWEKSVGAQRRELVRCEQLEIARCVLHPGAHLEAAEGKAGTRKKGAMRDEPKGNISKQEINGLKRIVKALDRLHKELKGFKVKMCLEATVGSGTNLGYDFAQLAYVRDEVKEPERLLYCFDTCHVTAAGYDLSTKAGAEHVFEVWDEWCGIERIGVFHVNDSVGARGSRLDRHAHIGQGLCGSACFEAVMNRREFQDVPKILETPKGKAENGESWDLINMRTLRGMQKRR